MKQIAFIALVLTLIFSQFSFLGASVSNNTIAIALMLLLLVLFSELAEFDFWGIRGRRKEEELKKLAGGEVITQNAVKPPSPYKLRQAEKLDMPGQMSNSKENFLSLTFEIERLLRIIARATNRQTLNDAALTPELVLTQLKEQGLITPTATVSIEKIREIRKKLLSYEYRQVTPEILEATQELAADIYTQLKSWLEQSRSGRT